MEHQPQHQQDGDAEEPFHGGLLAGGFKRGDGHGIEDFLENAGHGFFAQAAFRTENQAMAEDVRQHLFDVVRQHKGIAIDGGKSLRATRQGHGRARTAAEHDVEMLARGAHDFDDVAGNFFVHAHLPNGLLAGNHILGGDSHFQSVERLGRTVAAW